MDEHTPSVESSNPVLEVEVETFFSTPSDDRSSNGTQVSQHKSEVWNHFKKITSIDGFEKAECNYCHKFYSTGPKSGTSHLKRHMESCTRRKILLGDQTFLNPNLMKGKNEITVSTFDNNRSRILMANMVVGDEQPLAIVESKRFRIFLNSLQPNFKVPSRNTLINDIFKIYEEKKRETLRALSNVQGRIAITANMWTTDNQQKNYMAVTIHYIDNDWKLRNRLLRFIYVPTPHTSEKLANILKDCLMSLNIDNKFSSITVDNCSTNDVMIEKLKGKMRVGSLLAGGKLFHMRCFVHILNLIVKVGLETIKEVIECIRSSVLYWSATPKRVETFEDIAQILCIPCTKKLVLDCPTKWNSTFKMLESTIPYAQLFTRLAERDPQYTCVPSEDQWDLAKELCLKLKLFNSWTELFSRIKYPTSHCIFSIMCDIKYVLGLWMFDSNKVIRTMAEGMTEKFNSYWFNVGDIVAILFVLDPRYKMDGVEYLCNMLHGDEAQERIHTIKQLWYQLFHDYEARMKQTNDRDAGSLTQTSVSSSTISSSSLFTDSLSKFLKEKRARISYSTTEFDRYISEECVPETEGESFDILLWWKTYAYNYPIMQAIARDLLAIPSSTIASESAFSTSGRVINPHRGRLHYRTVEALMCVQSWLNNEDIDATDINAEGISEINRPIEGYFDQIYEDGDDLIQTVDDLTNKCT